MSRARPLGGVLAFAVLAALPCVCSAAQDAEAGPIDLSGTWAELQVCSQIEVLPLVGHVTSTSRSLLRATADQSGSGLIFRETYCSTVIDTGSALAKTVIPGAFLASLGELVRPAFLDASGATIQFVQPWYTQVRGARLVDPENDPLPTSPDDPRVLDQDGDGKPGLTVKVTLMGILSGEAYVVQRVRYRMLGTVISAARITGLIEWTNEQVTIGASSPLFGVDTKPTPNPVPEKSYFVMARIPATADCAEIVADEKTLFGR